MDWEKLYQDWLFCCNTKNFNQRLKIERQAVESRIKRLLKPHSISPLLIKERGNGARFYQCEVIAVP